MSNPIEDRHGNQIDIDDTVWTRARGGKHEGKVEKIATSSSEAKDQGVKNPPKVIFHDQHGHRVAHNPGTLEDLDKKK